MIVNPTVANVLEFPLKYRYVIEPKMDGRWTAIASMTVKILYALVAIFSDITSWNQFLTTCPELCNGKYQRLRRLVFEKIPLFHPVKTGVIYATDVETGIT